MKKVKYNVNKAISYIRYSTPKQRQGDSYRRQIKAAESYCNENDLELDHTILDDGVSGFTGRNAKAGALAQLLYDIDTGRIPRDITLIIESLDRLTRMEVEKAMNLLLSIVDKGVTIVTLMDNQVYRSGEMDMIRLMTSLVFMSRAHEESATKSRRLSAVWDKKRDQMRSGQRQHTRRPDWIDESYQVIPEKALSVKRLFDYLESGLGAAAVMRKLNSEGYTAPSGKPWALTSIKNLMNTQTVIGNYQPHVKQGQKRVPVGDIIEGYFPAIVEQSVYWKVRHMRKESQGSNALRRGVISNLFTGLVYCEHCGETCRYVSKGKNKDGSRLDYLVCLNRFKGLECEATYMHYSHVEKVVLTYLVMEGIDTALDKKPQTDVSHLKGELSAIKDGIDNVTDAIAQIGLNTALTERLNKLTKREVELKALIESSQMPAEKGDLKEKLQALSGSINDLAVRAHMHRLLQGVDLKVLVGHDKLIINAKNTLTRTLDHGVYTWRSDSGFTMQILKSGYIEQQQAIGRDCSHLKGFKTGVFEYN